MASERTEEALFAGLLDAANAPRDFSELERFHYALRSRATDEKTEKLVAAFLAKSSDAGEYISAAADRAKVQLLIDFWEARLGAINPELDDYSFSLKDFDPATAAALASSGRDAGPAAIQSSSVSLTAAKTDSQVAVIDEAKASIRFSALARLWQENKQLRGLLLTGEALEYAEKVCGSDPDIGELVKSSRQAKRRKNITLLGATVGAIVLVVALGSWIYSSVNPAQAQREAQWLTNFSNSGKIYRWPLSWIYSIEFAIWKISYYEMFMPASEIANIYLTGGNYKDVNLTKTELVDANFAVSRFDNVYFVEAKLPNSKFSDSPAIHANFTGAILSSAEFRRSRMIDTQFDRANLYRATFDYSILCRASFSEANLSKASFRGATIKDEAGFKDAAWWLATGWGRENLKKLRAVTVDKLHESTVFKDDLSLAEAAVLRAAPGSMDRAGALNRYALTLGSWGCDPPVKTSQQVESKSREPSQQGSLQPTAAAPAPPKCSPQPAEAGPGQAEDPVLQTEPAPSPPQLAQAADNACLKSSGMPASASAAAEQAVCIVERTQDYGASHNLYKVYNDTLGFSWLRAGQKEKALEAYRKTEGIDDDGGAKFRHGIALFANGHKDEALEAVEIATTYHRYMPSYELKWLGDYLFDGDTKVPNELLESALAYVDPLAEPVNLDVCPASGKP
ncbi:pentapeptide repeat-containing protein [Mesorhizobium sp.]|uniref:pentapeptide repeat-containing protein n=1 Tax=Mesorhizobium sp. TaxID=1871066 RepID=UPI00122061B2|nr:pentapeptide repeat-containing protein [Mesorhizobium sp.]TIL42779.1 MAG: pentapeptide repeat-containing protein [Mesorhizobium sp.]